MNRAFLVWAGVITLAAAAATFALAGVAATGPTGVRPLTAAAPLASPAVPAAAKPDPREPDDEPAAASVSAGMNISVEIDELRIGTLSIIPPTGTDTTEITVRTDAACPASSDGFSVGISRTDRPDGQLIPVSGPTSVGFSTTAPITAPLERTLREVGVAHGAPLQAGPYQLVLGCVDRASNTVRGLFVAQLQRGRSASAGGAVAYTGAPVRELFLTGLGLSGLGAVLLLVARRRVARNPTEES